MPLSHTCLRRLSLTVHGVRYEDLVRGFDTIIHTLCNFVGRPGSPATRHFESSARARPIQTRSADRVRAGLFDGTGQWRRNSRIMEPMLPLLEPWAERFGFDLRP